MASFNATEGTISFTHASLSKPCLTWYRSYGDLKNATRPPLVILHGGPGSTHDYLLSLIDMTEHHDTPIIFYDQLGGGRSTHLREKRLDEDFWTVELFIAELDNLLLQLGVSNRFDLLGQSWGGVLAASFAMRGHPGLRRLVISNSPASLELWVNACNRFRKQLPESVDDVLEKYEAAKDFSNQEYKDACMVWYKRHCCRTQPWPDYVNKSFELMDEDDTVYFTMNGPSEFTVIGSLRSFTLEGRLGSIQVPTLVLNGEHDAADAKAILPFEKEIKQVQSYTFPGCSHMCHVEERALYMQVVSKFLDQP